MSQAIDSDYAWLKSHLSSSGQIESRNRLVNRTATFIENRVSQGRLPYTLGLFGGWGTGKTTFLAALAEELEPTPAYRIVYFNSWKYAGFMEIVPALIYKILQYGIEGEELERSEAARRVVLA
ncbi:MAG: P-loop NTPase fold protein, partial [Acidobacteriaceae bacterium]